MPISTPVPIPMQVELGGIFAEFAGAEFGEQFRRRVTARLSRLLGKLGLPGEPRLMVLGDRAAPRAFRVTIHGRCIGSPPAVLMALWSAEGPLGFREQVPSGPLTGPGMPDGWLLELGEQAGPEASLGFASRAVAEIVRRRPAALINDSLLEAYAAGAFPAIPRLRLVMEFLLDRGVSLQRRVDILTLVNAGEARSESPEDTAERVFSRLRSSNVEIHLEPGYSRELREGRGDTAPPEHETIALLCDAMFYELGLRILEPRWQASSRVAQGMLTIKVNDFEELPLRGLANGELLAGLRPEETGPRGARLLRAAWVFDTSRSVSVVAADERIKFEKEGITTWDPYECAMLAVATAARRHAGALYSQEDTEYALAALEDLFPELVYAAMSRFTLAELTGVLRRFLDEGLSIRDLRGILERLLHFAVIEVNAGQVEVFDDRLPVDVPSPETTGRRLDQLVQFVRLGRRHEIALQLAPDGTAKVIQLEPPEEGDRPMPFDADPEALLASVWQVLGQLPARAPLPILLATTAERVRVRAAVALELPDLAVVARSELPAEVTIEEVGRARPWANRPSGLSIMDRESAERIASGASSDVTPAGLG